MNYGCANREEWLGAFVYDDLAFDEGVKAEEHVRGCAGCREEAESLKALRQWLPPATEVPMARKRRLGIVAAAAVVVAAAAGFAMGRETVPEPVKVAEKQVEEPKVVVIEAPVPAPRSLFSPEVMALLSGPKKASEDGQK